MGSSINMEKVQEKLIKVHFQCHMSEGETRVWILLNFLYIMLI